MTVPFHAFSTEREVADRVRDLMAEHQLTQRDVATLCCVSLKTVEGWMADVKAASFRRMAPRHLAMITYALPGFIAARNSRKASA